MARKFDLLFFALQTILAHIGGKWRTRVAFLGSRKGVELTSLTAINFRVFRRAESCKVLLDCDSSRQNPSKIYLP